MMGTSDDELLPRRSEAVVWALVCALDLSRELVCPGGKLNLCFGEHAQVRQARPRVTTLLDVRQRSSIVGGDPVAALQVEVEEGAA